VAEAVYLPKVGMTMEEGILNRWLVPEGATVERGQPIFEMETEKVLSDVEADGAGVLKQLVEERTNLKPGAVVGCLLGEGEAEVPRELLDQVASQWSESAEPAEESAADNGDSPRPPAIPAAVAAGMSGDGERVIASPIARRLAREHHVDLATLAGSGPNGRITEADVMQRVEQAVPEDGAVEAPAPAGESVPYRGRRRVIGERMHESLRSMAQLTLAVEARVDEPMRMIRGLNREWREDRVVTTLTALVVRASALALREHPRLNARLDGDSITLQPAVNIGFAIDDDEGVIVPVVQGADELGLKDVARRIVELSEQVKSGNLSVDAVTGGTFTVSSLESFAVDTFTPVINPPQAAILGVGRVREVPVIEDGEVARGQTTTLSLTIDHRVNDGAPAARFLGRVMQLLERPYLLM
jgi:pyruvate/2-oxoglutarate dehydrogenase complex dihydrolipoamide acyltransferase (E2) component